QALSSNPASFIFGSLYKCWASVVLPIPPIPTIASIDSWLRLSWLEVSQLRIISLSSSLPQIICSATNDEDSFFLSNTLLPNSYPTPPAFFRPRSSFWLKRNSRSSRTSFSLDSKVRTLLALL
ncbi:hypothetical protein V8G54_022861, partial [Vigna mungo]